VTRAELDPGLGVAAFALAHFEGVGSELRNDHPCLHAHEVVHITIEGIPDVSRLAGMGAIFIHPEMAFVDPDSEATG